MIYLINEVSGRIRNIESMPKGLNARYLECLESHHEIPELIASQWRRKLPKTLKIGYAIVDFEGGK